MRGVRVAKRELELDPIYNSRLVTRFINRVMKSGNKETARNVIYDALEKIREQGKDPLEVFEGAMRNVSPRLEVRPRRVGGASYQVPMEVRGDRREALAIRWLVAAARSRNNKDFHSMAEKLASEFMDAMENKGGAIKKKEDTQRMAEANRAFAHFRW